MATWGAWKPDDTTTKRVRLGIDFWYTGEPANGYVTVHKKVYAQCRYHFTDNQNDFWVAGTAGAHDGGSVAMSFASDDEVITIFGEGTENVALSASSTTSVTAGASISGIDYIGTSQIATVSVGLTLPVIPPPPISLPAAPTIGTNVRNTDASNTLVWTNNPTEAAPYTNVYVERSVDGGAYALLITLSGVTTTHTDTTTSANHSYAYRVRASNSAGYGAYSAASSTTYNTPGAPTGCVASHTAPAEVTITWADTSPTETAFEIDRSLNAGVDWTNVDSVSAGVTSYVDTLTPGDSAVYRVRATRGALVSAYSATSNSVTIPVGVTFTSAHTVVATGLLTKARYSVDYAVPPTWHANVKVYHGTVAGELLANVTLAPDTDLVLDHAVALGNTVTMVVTTVHPIVGGAWAADFYEATEDNTWTFLGYADDQLVGMTANLQLWNAPLADFELANALVLTTPTALVFGDLSVVGTGLTISATATLPFRISVCHTVLNRFGPTLPSTPLVFWASKPTIQWSSTGFVKVSATAVNGEGIDAVELYFVEDEYQEFAFLGRVNVPEITAGSPPPATKPWTYNWIGYQMDVSMWAVANLTVPALNYTGGAPASQLAVLDGQLYFWGGVPAHRIWVGGGPGNRFSVSPGTGGGYVDVEPGTGTIVSKVLKFKTQQGAAIVTALCDNPNSQRENRFNLVETGISLSNEQNTKTWQAEKIAGTVGCKSSRGAIVAGDGLYAVSRYGLAITTLTMEYNSQLQVMYVSDPIAPVFLKQYGTQLNLAVLFEVNGVLYMTFGSPDSSLDNVLFCYDIALKAWWTYTLDTDTPILNMISIDHEGGREGIGIITADHVYLLPTTRDESTDALPTYDVLIESGELTSMQPLQAMHHLSQLEFRFDYFVGDLDITITMIDQFGRTIETVKSISHFTPQHQLSEYMRIDAVVESYKIRMNGPAKFRLTHFLAKIYPKSNRIGMVWGFDNRQSHSSSGSIHRTFASYNDLRDAIIP